MSWDERSHPLDSYKYATPADTGTKLAGVFREWTGTSLLSTAEYLVLGAGGANGELAFAAELGIGY